MPPLSIRGAWPRGAIRAHGSSLPLVLIKRLAHVRGGCTPDNSRLWQLASLVLIKRLTRVRGGCTPGKSRLGQLAPLVLIKRLAHVRAVGG